MRIKIGLVGTSQKSFPGPKEEVYAKICEQMKQNAQEMGFDFVAWEKQVIYENEAKECVKFMEEQHVDFFMVLNVSYSAGFLTPIFYKIKGAKVGIWSIPEPHEGVTLFNSFCSNNMYQGINTQYFKDFGIKCKWFYGMADDPQFKRRLWVTVKALGAIKKLKNSKVALIGGFAPGFYDLYFDERSVITKLDGIQINRLHEYDEIIKLANEVTDEEVKPFLDDLDKKGIKCTPNVMKLRGWSIKMYLAYKKFIDMYHYDAIAVSCWPKFQDDYKYSVCSVLGMLNDDGVVAACEGDLMSAISMVALQDISDESTSLMDFAAFDNSDDSIMLWHCGPGSLKFCRHNGYTLDENYSGMEHPKGKIVGTAVVRNMVFDPNKITVFRFSGDMDRYINLTGVFMGDVKPSNCGSRGWMNHLKLNNKEINAQDFTNTVLSSGIEHHYPMCLGDYGEVITEMNKWLGIKPVRKIKYENYLQDSEDMENE